MITNCIFINNSADDSGGGGYGGSLYGCSFIGNSASSGGGVWGGSVENSSFIGNAASSGGGANESILYNCLLRGNLCAGDGGGACNSTLHNCQLSWNYATNSGGGAAASILHNSTLFCNWAFYGGGADGGTLHNCTLTGNVAVDGGGGANYGMLYNCIVYYNTALVGGNYYASIFKHSCTSPRPPAGDDNIADDPQLASASHLSATSPCIGAGSSAYSSGADIDGELWPSPPCMGADQYMAGGATGSLAVVIVAAYTNAATGFAVSLTAQIEGHATASVWDFGDGTGTQQPTVCRSCLDAARHLCGEDDSLQ